MDSNQERQRNEFQALQSIFEADLQDMRKAAWNVPGPLHLKLSLKPQQSMGGAGQSYVSLDMMVDCSAMYPDEVPELTLTNVKGVSQLRIKELKEDLDRQALEHLGEVMIWELANTVQEFLYKNNKPPEQSFHEQMMKNKREQLEREQEQQRLLEEKERQKIEEEVLRHQAAIRDEKQKRREDHKNAEWSTPLTSPAIGIPRQPSFSPTPSPILPISPSRSKPYDDLVHPQTPTGTFAVPFPRRRRRTSTPKQGEEDEYGASPNKDYSTGVTVLNFVCNKAERQIHRGVYLGHSPGGSIVYAGMDAASGELVAVAEWVIKWRNVHKKAGSLDKEEDSEGAACMKQVAAIEQEISSLVKLKHSNLIRYLALKHQYDPGKITIHILSEYSGGSNLSIHVQRKEQLPLEVIRMYTTELLEALKYLHKNSIVHKDLRPSSVFVDSLGRIRLSDYSIGKRLADLYSSVNKTGPGVRFSDSKPMVIGRGQKGDIYQLGLMLLTLILGKQPTETIPEIPKSLPSTLQDFLNKCLLTDERVRGTAAQLREHNFIKEPLQQVLKLPDSFNKKEKKNDAAKEEEDSDNKEDENFEYLLSLVASGQSRLTSEFELIKVLGKGGFGDVLKVKNKLDGRFYAIKRIPINPKSKLFNKKMKREVKLLSRLNHENVVRYYCSWIEVSDDPAHSDASSSFASSSRTAEPPPASKKAPHIVKSIPLTKTPVLKTGMKSNQSLDPIGDLDNLVPPVSDESIEWLTSFDQDRTTLDSSDDEEEDEADVFGSSFMPRLDASDDSIVFGSDEKDETESESKSEVFTKETTSNFPADNSKPRDGEDNVIKLLYIQMEYCEKSTLRDCIDDGLCQDMDRVWRLFREVIEGLVHIHGQGMIHRDLKPVNIFLDSNDHVKIGDFGLATTDILVKGSAADLTLPSPQDAIPVHSLRSHSSYGNLTGKVGTALYVSPEVMQGTTKVHYDQKVDIYSLGIIFFEMCYNSLPTGMERVKVISSLRLPTVELPKDFQGGKVNQAKIITWLLNHDPSLRPTSKELLTSDLLPPALMQENELIELLKSTIAKPLSSSHRQMMSTIFNQNTSTYADISYDHDIYESAISNKTALIYKKVEESLIKVFTNHGAIHVPTPLFMPGLGIYDGNEQCVRLMDHKGGIVMVPMDHRVPFARYVGRCGVRSMKRYAIEKVFRERKSYNVDVRMHPRELAECSFDIITPSLNLIPDAEVLTLAQEIINEFPTLKARNYYIRISHISILKAVFLHHGIPESQHLKALTIVSENYTNKQKRLALLESELKLNLSEQAALQLTSMLDLEGPLDTVSHNLKSITKSMGQASSLCKSGLHDLEHILSYCKPLGLSLEVLICVGLIYNPNQFSGLMFQVMCNSRKKKRIVPEVLAAGGRYDRLFEKHMFQLHPSASRHPPHGVGISISFDRLVAVVAEDKEMKSLSPCDVVICSLGHQLLLNKKLTIAKTLWSAGFRTVVHYDKTENFDELQANCKEQGVSNIIILKDGESSRVKVLCLEQERTVDSIVMIGELVDHLQRGTQEMFSNSNHGDTVTTVNSNSSNSCVFNFSIQFLVQEKGNRNQPVAKRRHEAMIAGKVTASFPWLPEKNVEVLALDIPISLIKTIQAYLELGDEQCFEASQHLIIERSMKYRKYLTGVFEVIHNIRFKRKCNYIILYSMTDESMRLLT